MLEDTAPGPVVKTMTNTVPLDDELEELEVLELEELEVLELEELEVLELEELEVLELEELEVLELEELPDEEVDALELLVPGLTPPFESPESLELQPRSNNEHSRANTSLNTIILRFCRHLANLFSANATLFKSMGDYGDGNLLHLSR